MKKFITSLIVMVIAVSFSLSAFATTGFNKAVFNDGKDITVKSDSMTGETTVYTTSLLQGNGTISTGWNEKVVVYGAASIVDEFDINTLIMSYYADDWAFIDEVIVKVGNTRYTFTDFDPSRKILSDGSIRESVDITVKSATIPFMQDLIKNRDKEVRVRLCGSRKNIEFVLTDDIKNSWINLYNLFVAGGGTAKSNMNVIDIVDDTSVKTVKD